MLCRKKIEACKKMWYDNTMETEWIKQLLAQRGMSPNKALGQNFLISAERIGQILNAAAPDGARVLEIGPGCGALTEGLCARAANVVAVEKDAAMAQLLRESLPADCLTVVTGDFLQVDVPALMACDDWIAVGNLPYYVTTPIVEKLIALAPQTMTLMVQSEAAERFFARPGGRVYGPVAVVAQACYRPERICEAGPSCFWPAPEVSSTVVRLSRRQDTTPEPAELLAFCKMIFALRRKTLRNVLQRPAWLDTWLEQNGQPLDVRAEAMNPETLTLLFFSFRKEKNQKKATAPSAEA